MNVHMRRQSGQFYVTKLMVVSRTGGGGGGGGFKDECVAAAATLRFWFSPQQLQVTTWQLSPVNWEWALFLLC